ncbi:MAG: hypothetical protein ACMUEL_08110 [Flavobacteriales bacterium Tduv]
MIVIRQYYSDFICSQGSYYLCSVGRKEEWQKQISQRKERVKKEA